MIYKILNTDLTTIDCTEVEFTAAKDLLLTLFNCGYVMLLTDSTGSPIGYVLLPSTHVRQTILNPMGILSIRPLIEKQ